MGCASSSHRTRILPFPADQKEAEGQKSKDLLELKSKTQEDIFSHAALAALRPNDSASTGSTTPPVLDLSPKAAQDPESSERTASSGSSASRGRADENLGGSRISLLRPSARSSVGINYEGIIANLECGGQAGQEVQTLVKLVELKDQGLREDLVAKALRAQQARRHPNVVSLLGSELNKDTVYLAEELVLGIPVLEAASSSPGLCEQDAALASRQLLLGLQYLSSIDIELPGLQPEDILFSQDPSAQNGRMQGQLRIMDCGLSAIKFRLASSHFPAPFIPPEVLETSKDNQEPWPYRLEATENQATSARGNIGGVWSVGVLICLLLTGEVGGIAEGLENPWASSLNLLSAPAEEALRRLLQTSATKRPSTADCLETLEFVALAESMTTSPAGTQESIALFSTDLQSRKTRKAVGGLRERLEALGVRHQQEEELKKQQDHESRSPLRKVLNLDSTSETPHGPGVGEPQVTKIEEFESGNSKGSKDSRASKASRSAGSAIKGVQGIKKVLFLGN